MPRKKNKARRRVYSRMTFRQMCYALGVTPLQRVKIIKYLKNIEGGEVLS